jgi:hypothetical protein
VEASHSAAQVGKDTLDGLKHLISELPAPAVPAGPSPGPQKSAQVHQSAFASARPHTDGPPPRRPSTPLHPDSVAAYMVTNNHLSSQQGMATIILQDSQKTGQAQQQSFNTCGCV